MKDRVAMKIIEEVSTVVMSSLVSFVVQRVVSFVVFLSCSTGLGIWQVSKRRSGN